MTKKKSNELSNFHVTCPFCGYLCDRTTNLTWCSNCFCEWYINKKGDFIFDNQRKTIRFALAKSIQRSGGVKFGNSKTGSDKK